MKITLGKEKVVAIGPRMEDSYWGQWQFPKLMEGKDGRVVLTFHNGDDVWEELGAADVWAVSDDRGETWNGVKDHTTIQKGVLLPSGDFLRQDGRPSVPLDLTKIEAPMQTGNYTIPSDDLHAKSNNINKLPLPRGQFHDIWKQRWSVYHMDELPDGLFDHLKEWPMLRTPSGQTEERAEWSTLDWENRGLLMMFPTSRNVAIPAMPNFIGKLKVGPDGKLWAATYNKGLNPRNGAFSPYSSTFVLCSEDEGHSWKMQGYLPYIPDNDESEIKENETEFDKRNFHEVLRSACLVLILIVCGVILAFVVRTYMIISEQADRQQIVISDSGIGVADNNNYIVDLPDGTVVVAQTETLQNSYIGNIDSVNNVTQNNANNTTQVTQTETTQTLPAQTTTAAATTNSNGKININTASLDELMALDGVGEKKAQAIIDYRYENGRFNSIEELTNVSGIGEKTFEKNKDRITVG